jgi:hypothetical protein
MLKRLPDAYCKETDGNIGKLFKIIAKQLDEIEQVNEDIKAAHEIDGAIGYSLDKVGGNVQQLRGQTADDVYRVLIKSKIQRNLSDGGIETIIEIVSFLLNIPKADISITETWSTEPASMQISVPSGAINSVGLSLYQFGQLIDSIAAGGVKVASLFEGTFALSSQYDVSETDASAGLADDAQTTGGTLGAYYDPGKTPLPL